MTKMKNSVIICAAGAGKRMNSVIAKQYLELQGKSILAHTIDAFEKSSDIDEIVIVTGKDDIDFVKEKIIKKYGYKKINAVAAGGKERQNSVYNGLAALSKDTDIVLIHDGVRPFVSQEDIHKIVEETKIYKACVTGVRVKDTIKLCDDKGNIVSTPDRACLWAAQTPQAFEYKLINEAYKKAFDDNILGTDDSMLAERIGVKVKMIEGSYYNIKITTPEDLFMGENILSSFNEAYTNLNLKD